MIHIEGFIQDKSNGWGTQIEIKQPGMLWGISLAESIDTEIFKVINRLGKLRKESREKYKNEDVLIGVEVSSYNPDIAMRVYYSDKECDLEEAQKNVVLNILGCLDIYQVETGYSEWTIMGYDTENFKLVSDDGGDHDLNIIFAGLNGKYVHILIDVMQDEKERRRTNYGRCKEM